jgi:hypothetical protein
MTNHTVEKGLQVVKTTPFTNGVEGCSTQNVESSTNHAVEEGEEVVETTPFTNIVESASTQSMELSSSLKKFLILISLLVGNVVVIVSTMQGLSNNMLVRNVRPLQYGSQTHITNRKSHTKAYRNWTLAMANNTKEVDVRLKTPFTAVISGPTGSGKTELLKRFVDERETVVDVSPLEIIYCYGAWQNRFDDFDGVNFHEGMIDAENGIPSDGKPRWIVVDDLMEEAGKTSNLLNLFTKFSHHKNVSVFFVTQNLFHKSLRSITIQAQYIALFKSPRDKTAPMYLGRQFYPTNPLFLTEVYEDATSRPYSFLWLDLKQTTPDHARVLGNFLSPDQPLISYTPT